MAIYFLSSVRIAFAIRIYPIENPSLLAEIINLQKSFVLLIEDFDVNCHRRFGPDIDIQLMLYLLYKMWANFFFWIRTPTKQKLPYRPSKIAKEIRKTVKVTFLYLLRKHAGKDINCLVTNVSVTVTCLIYYVFFFGHRDYLFGKGHVNVNPVTFQGAQVFLGKQPCKSVYLIQRTN